MIRTYLYVAAVFVIAFFGISWAIRGFPMNFSGLVGAGSTLAGIFGAPGADDPERKRSEAQRAAQNVRKPSLDTIRLEALQAATGFAMSPCDSNQKKNFIEALTAYVGAIQDKLDCPRPLNMMIFCSKEKLKAAAETFSTPLDQRVRAAFAEALSQPGIVMADFPDALRVDMLRFGGSAPWVGGGSPGCQPQMRSNIRNLQ